MSTTVTVQEPDYALTMANEQTFLAWIRTALALIAGGVGLMQLVPSFGFIPGVHHGMSIALVVNGGILSGVAVRRWQLVQNAMRHRAPLPSSRMPIGLGLSMLVITGLLIALMTFEPNVR